MKIKLASIITALLISYTSYSIAEEPHIIPAPGCPSGEICCPIAVVCSFLEGCGDSGDWSAWGHAEFEGIRHFVLRKISAISIMDGKKNGMMCEYDGTISLGGTIKYSMAGSGWVYGFMKKTAECPSGNPLNCRLK